MQGLVELNKPVTLEVNFDPGKFVGLTVYNCSTGVPIQFGAVIPMLAVEYTLYAVNFTPTAVGPWLFQKNVYTDGTYAVIDTGYATGSETLQVLDIAGIFLNALLAMYQNPGSVGAALSAGTGTVPTQFVAEAEGSMYTIYQGGKPPQLVVRLIDPSTNDPLNLTGVTTIESCFLQTDGTELPISLLTGEITILSTTLGKIGIQLTAAETALLQTVQGGTLQLAISFGGDPIIYQLPNAYDVVQNAC